MPLSNSILNPQTVTKEQLAFDVGGSVGSDFIGGGGATAGTQGPQGSQGPQGTQGVQGVQGAFFIGAQGTQGQSVYIGPTANLASTPNVVYNNTAGNDQVFIGQQGALANVPPLVVEANDQQNAFASEAIRLRHNMSNASSGTAPIGVGMVFAAQSGATKDSILTRLNAVNGTTASGLGRHFELATVFGGTFRGFLRVSPFLNEQLNIANATTTNAQYEISRKILLTQDGSSPANGFGAIETIQLQTNAGSTPQNVAHHKYTLTTASEASRKSQYTLTTYDKTLNATTSDFDVIDAEARQTVFTAWSNTLNTRTTGFIFNTDAAVAGTPSGAFGTAIELQAKTDTVSGRTLAFIESQWTNFTDASRASNLTLRVARSGSLGRGITLTTSNFGQGFSSLSSFSSGTNGGLVLNPKGTGYLKAGVDPDGTATNGNSPGNYAVDLMLGSKSNAVQVAGGQFSSLLGGTTNQIGTSNNYASIIGGQANIISGTGTHNAIIAGSSNTVTSAASYGVVLGGRFNYIDGANAIILGGDNNISSNSNSVVMGTDGQSRGNNTFNISGGSFASIYGDAMSFQVVLRGQTTNTTTPLNLSNDSTAFYAHPDNTSIIWDINVVGRTSTGITNGYHLRGTTKRNGGGNVEFVGAVDSLERENNLSWDTDLVIDTTDLRVQVTGTATQTIRWVAHVRATMVTY